MMCIGDFFSVVGRPWPPTPQVPFVSSGGRTAPVHRSFTRRWKPVRLLEGDLLNHRILRRTLLLSIGASANSPDL